MKKVILSAVMCFALLASGSIVAQDNKDAKAKTEKTSTNKEKKDCCKKDEKKADKKSCCKDDAKKKDTAAAGTKKASCCKK